MKSPVGSCLLITALQDGEVGFAGAGSSGEDQVAPVADHFRVIVGIASADGERELGCFVKGFVTVEALPRNLPIPRPVLWPRSLSALFRVSLWRSAMLAPSVGTCRFFQARAWI